MSLVGKTLDRYRITEQLGQDGMMVVYKAYDTRLERVVTIKVICTETVPPVQVGQLQKRFEREAEAQAGFDHPNIMPVYDSGEHQGVPYLVMAYRPGRTLKQLTGTSMPYQKAAALLAPVADALAYAHQRKVLHRDVTPSNILIGEDGTPALTDFGIARLLGEVDEATLTGTGTLEYMAPEQWEGQAAPQTDIYALGVVFYELVTGRKPYSADSPEDMRLMQSSGVLPRLFEFAPGLPEEVEKVIFKALAPNPGDRYESMAEFAGVLKGLAEVPIDTATIDNPTRSETKNESAVEEIDPRGTLIGEPHDILDGSGVEEIKIQDSQPRFTLPGMRSGMVIVLIGLLLLAAGVLSGIITFGTRGSISNMPSFGGKPTPTSEEGINEAGIEPQTLTQPANRVGGWLDTIELSVVSADSAVSQIGSGAIDIYGANLSAPADFQAIADAGLENSFQYGLLYEITFNPVGPVFDGSGKLNPFSSMRIREAMNWLIDRDYINQKVYGGKAIPKYFSLVSGSPEYGRYIDLIRPYELKYAPNREKAVQVITEEMTAMGAEMVDGKWTYEGEPVELIFLIRKGDDTRMQIGVIISGWLEEIGFTVDRQYKTSFEASTLWLYTNLREGQWHLYTDVWSSGGVSRDDSDDFQFFLSPSSSYGDTDLWQSYIMEPEEQKVFDDLAKKLYTDMDDRRAMFQKAFDIAMKYSYRMWVVDSRAVSPWSPEVSVSFDLSAGVDLNTLYPFTLRRVGEVGGAVRMGEPNLFIDPANPIAGSNWPSDSVWKLPTQDYDAIPNPYTGITLPQRLERAEVVVKTGLPVDQTYDWVDLSFSDEIVPPDDAWVNWDVDTETFLTVADWKKTVILVGGIKAAVADAAAAVNFATLDAAGVTAFVEAAAAIYGEQSGKTVDVTAALADAQAVPVADPGEIDQDLRPLMEIRLEAILAAKNPAAELAAYALEFIEAADIAGLFEFAGYDYTSALRKVTYYYPADLFETVTWHDGSPMTIGDFVMPMIMRFATGKEGSPLYDPSAASTLAAYLVSFKGQRIVSTDPLVIELYSDAWYADAENNAVPYRTVFWPDYGYGQSSWGMIAVSNKAEENYELAYSQDKADANEIEWMNWVGGPSLQILAAMLDEAIVENHIPFEPTLSQYVTADEAALRYANLKTFYEEYSHFWVGTGPYILKDVSQAEKTAALIHNPDFPDPADKWAMFSCPMVAELTIDGAGRVTIGEEAVFDVYVEFEGAPYPADQVSGIKYLLLDANNNIIEVGAAEFVTEGQYRVTLSARTTGKLEAGDKKLEVVSIVIPVSIPTITAFKFVAE